MSLWNRVVAKRALHIESCTATRISASPLLVGTGGDLGADPAGVRTSSVTTRRTSATNTRDRKSRGEGVVPSSRSRWWRC